ncbi:lipase family protein [Paraburkholderia elongata]|uniref:Alpha/beta hydrolase n=1 Tax=Paraburkholderia elongata TaxID=2675747 RepID=A0A972NHU9_9BURK|nr:hypothetical protein [Paraburkholderia elongata]NPT53628.1 hypothetical protein [Paraburkholderia elongata]
MKRVLDASKTSNPEVRPSSIDLDALVFVHGFLDSQAAWNPLIKALAHTGIPALAVQQI